MRTTTAIITGIIRLSGEELTGVQATKAETRQQAFFTLELLLQLL